MATNKVRNTTATMIAHGSFLDAFPGAIEASERQGQRELVRAQQFPADMRQHRAVFEAMGIEFIGPTDGDTLFLDCRLPKGWAKVATDHAMWSHLVDDKGRRRASIFYKAAFYDRKAHASPICRFSLSTRSFDGYARWIGYVHDSVGQADPGGGARVVWASEPAVFKARNFDGEKPVLDAALAWLTERAPNFADPLAHWDDEPMPTACAYPAWR